LIDERTGLPVTPWDHCYWSVRKASAGYDFHYIQLRGRVKWLPFLTWEIEEEPVFSINDQNLRAAASKLLRKLEGPDSYVGDYPPKKVGPK
jgi:hypothetical protein